MDYFELKRICCVALLTICGGVSVLSQNVKDVESYVDKVVSASVAVTGNDTLHVKDVFVTDNGFLMLAAPKYVSLEGEFEVAKGGSLFVGRPVKSYKYDYDPNGNRIVVTVVYK